MEFNDQIIRHLSKEDVRKALINNGKYYGTKKELNLIFPDHPFHKFWDVVFLL